jgi:hypothetical protein
MNSTPCQSCSLAPGCCCRCRQTGILDFMDQYAKIDHTMLVRNLNVVCRELGNIRNGLLTGVFPDPRPLSHTEIENGIPLALYKIAVACEWIEEQTELSDDEYHASKDADLFGGSLFLTASFKEWFLGLVADTLADLEVKASENDEAREERFQFQMAHPETWPQAKGLAAPKATVEDHNPAKKKIDEFFSASKTVFTLQGLADAASKPRADGYKCTVSRVRVSNIYNGFGANPEIRQAVAEVISQSIPCNKDDLKGTRKRERIDQ